MWINKSNSWLSVTVLTHYHNCASCCGEYLCFCSCFPVSNAPLQRGEHAAVLWLLYTRYYCHWRGELLFMSFQCGSVSICTDVFTWWGCNSILSSCFSLIIMFLFVIWSVTALHKTLFLELEDTSFYSPSCGSKLIEMSCCQWDLLVVWCVSAKLLCYAAVETQRFQSGPCFSVEGQREQYQWFYIFKSFQSRSACLSQWQWLLSAALKRSLRLW